MTDKGKRSVGLCEKGKGCCITWAWQHQCLRGVHVLQDTKHTRPLCSVKPCKKLNLPWGTSVTKAIGRGQHCRADWLLHVTRAIVFIYKARPQVPTTTTLYRSLGTRQQNTTAPSTLARHKNKNFNFPREWIWNQIMRLLCCPQRHTLTHTHTTLL